MAKKKVFEVAKQFAISPVALLRQLKELGSSATSPMSVVEPAILEELEKTFQAARAARRKKTVARKPAKTPAETKAATKKKTTKKTKAAEEPEKSPAPVAEAKPAAQEVVVEPAVEEVVEPGAADAVESPPAAAASTEIEPVVEPIAEAEAPQEVSEPAAVVEPEAAAPPPAEEEPQAAPVEEAEPVAVVAAAEPDPQAEPVAEAETEAKAEAPVAEVGEPVPDAEPPPAEETPRRTRVIPAPRQTARILFKPTTPVAATPPPKSRGRAGATTGGYRMDPLRPREPAAGQSDDRGGGRGGGRRGGTSMAGAVSRRAEKKRKKRQAKQAPSDARAVQASVRKTMAQMTQGDRRKKRRRDREDENAPTAEEQRVIQMAEFATVSELASALEVGENEVILQLFTLGVMATRNQRLEMDTITMIAEEFGVSVQPLSEIGEDRFEQEPEDEGNLVSRHPVVTVMGHVDHGKTSLLDQIRRSNIVRGEKGGITQHIGAYEVQTKRGRITFMDTPGHEAFTAMRMRGAQVTDLVILVVAADDGVMPQTVEAIDHARAAKVPIVVAVNKCDLPAANPLRVKQMLTEHNLLVEDFGGAVQTVEVSAKSGQGLDRLLETVLLEAEMLELKASSSRRADGVVVEAYLDKGKGPVATVLVQQGTLRPGDAVIAGLHNGKVRALLDERDKRLEEAGPASPAKILGLSGVPQAGDSFHVVRDEREAREIASQRGAAKRTSELKRAKVTLDGFLSQVREDAVRELPIIVKGDVDGSVEALSDSLERLSNDEVRVEVIRRGVGGITESDVMLADTSSAVIIGFHVRPADRARALAVQEQVDIRLYDVIYDAVSDVRMALEGLLAPELKEKIEANVEVREIFRVPKVGVIAGCYVLSGKIHRNARVRVVRDDVVIFDSTVSSLRRFKDVAREVAEGFECGVGVERFNDLKVGDRLEVYAIAEIARKLEASG